MRLFFFEVGKNIMNGSELLRWGTRGNWIWELIRYLPLRQTRKLENILLAKVTTTSSLHTEPFFSESIQE
jgi:hypothetical protein